MAGIFNQIKSQSTAQEVAHELESLILEGVLRQGDQLPGERELASRFGVSRPVLRQAISLLEERQILVSRHGGGTFVGDVIGTVFSPQIAGLLPNHKRITRDYLEYRREVEAIAAGFAAERATVSDLEQLQQLTGRMREAHETPDFELETRLDVEFHSLVGEMAHNLILLHTLRSCYELLERGIFENRSLLYSDAAARQAIFDQHMAIATAIINGDVSEASAAAALHIDYICRQTENIQLDQERERVAQLRLLQRQTRGQIRGQTRGQTRLGEDAAKRR